MKKKTFIIADAFFYDKVMAKKNGFKTAEDYNQKIIENINSVVDDNSIIVFFGELCSNDKIKEAVKEIKEKINGRKYMRVVNDIEDSEFDDNFRKLKTDLCQCTENDEKFIITTNNPDIYAEEDNYYFCCPNSGHTQSDVYKNKYLNISCDKWNLKPIEIGDNLVQIIEDYVLFDSMKNYEEVLS